MRIDRPILRIPSLAITSTGVRENGLKLNAQKHLQPILGLSAEGSDEVGALKALLARELGVDGEQTSWDLSLMDVNKPSVGGVNGEFIFCPRMDNQAMCHAALIAL